MIVLYIVFGIVLGVIVDQAYRAYEKRAWKYAVHTLSEAKAKVEANFEAERIRLTKLFDGATKELKQSYVTALEGILAKGEAEIRAEVEKVLATAKSII